ncbi:MAG TPA: prepilin-type N-terminal cleavage/methylation domain-containing protein [Gemmatimonadaceae bacterium]|nr:prepilin-type N-terminal cleavage/methylation domain-containing protein [Gemmatimonadaceae bacterium]
MRSLPHTPEGFTLLEILVALTLLGVGILGLAASSALVSRMSGDGSRLTLAATLAIARVEQLRARSCESATAGGATTRGIEERWTVAPMGASPARALEVHLSVTYRIRVSHGGDAARTQRFSTAIPCDDA